MQTYTTEQLTGQIYYQDDRITVLPETWKLVQVEHLGFTMEWLSGDVALNLRGIPHTLSFELNIATPPNEEAEVLLSYRTMVCSNEPDRGIKYVVGYNVDPMRPWSPRDILQCIKWRVNDSLMGLIEMVDAHDSGARDIVMESVFREVRHSSLNKTLKQEFSGMFSVDSAVFDEEAGTLVVVAQSVYGDTFDTINFTAVTTDHVTSFSTVCVRTNESGNEFLRTDHRHGAYQNLVTDLDGLSALLGEHLISIYADVEI